MEPERFAEIVEIWQDRLNQVSDEAYPLFAEELLHLENHLSRAETLLSLVVDNEDSLPTPLVEKLNSEPQAMAAIDEHGILQAQNGPALNQYSDCEGKSFRELPFAEDATEAIADEIRFLSDKEKKDVVRRLVPSSRSDNDQPVIISFSRWITPGGRRMLLVKTIDFAWPDHLTPLVMSAFGLTEAEAQVMRGLVEGETANSIAELRGSSVATVRTQIRSIYAKTATRSQSEFLRMAIGLTTLELIDRQTLSGAFPATPKAIEPPFPRPDQRSLLELPDGRFLDCAEFGAANGDPCIFCHSEFFGDVWPADLVHLATQHNLRIIAPARPFYARSSPLPKKANPYEQFNADLLSLLDQLGIDKAVHVTQQVGGVFSVMFAAAHPTRVAGTVAVSPMFPVQTVDDERKMPMFARFVSGVVNRQPRMLEFVARLALTYHNRVGSKRFLSAIYQDTPVDLGIVEDPDNLGAIVQGFQYTTANGYSGYIHDYRNLAKDRREKWVQNASPLIALVGAEDKNTREARTDGLIADGARIEKRIIAGAGQFMFFSHPEAVIAAIRDAWDNA